MQGDGSMARFCTTVSGGLEHKIFGYRKRRPELITQAIDNALLHAQQLDVKDQGAVGGNTWKSFATVRKACGDGESAFTSNLHTSNSDIPALDDFASTELESKRLTLLVCYLKVSDMPVIWE